MTATRPTPRCLTRSRPLSCRRLPAHVVADLQRRERREIEAAYAQRTAA